MDIPIISKRHSRTELFPELFCPRSILTREKSSIFRWSIPLKFFISIFLNPSIVVIVLRLYDNYNSLLWVPKSTSSRSLISTWSRRAISTNCAIDGCVLFVFHHETVMSVTPICSASHRLVICLSANTTLILFWQSFFVIYVDFSYLHL